MAKKKHASVRIDDDLYTPLKEEAGEKFEGNISLLIRKILRNYVENKDTLKEVIQV